MTRHNPKPIPEAPCDTCKHKHVCGIENKACEHFAWYVMASQIDERIPKSPTFTMHYRLFDISDHKMIYKEITEKMKKECMQ